MAEIKLYDYTDLVDDGWFGTYEVYHVIGQGKLSAGNIVPLIEAVPEDEEITVKIFSCGGYVFDGWAIYNALKAHKAKVTVRIDGLAASIASIIAMAGDEVVVCAASLLMVHKPSVDLFWGAMDADQLKREAAALDQIQTVLNSIYVAKTGLDSVTIDAMINAETWITPTEAVTLGFANSIDNTITEKQPIAENSFRQIFKNANPMIKAYANNAMQVNKTKENNMENVSETLKKNNDLLTQVGTFFKNLVTPPKDEVDPTNSSIQLEDESYIYFDGELAVGTMVFSDEAMTISAMDGDHTLMDGRTITVSEGSVSNIQDVVEDKAQNDLATQVANLTAELSTLKAENSTLLASVNASNEALAKIKNIKSTYEPAAREQEISRQNTNAKDAKPDFSAEARLARKQEILDKKNKK